MSIAVWLREDRDRAHLARRHGAEVGARTGEDRERSLLSASGSPFAVHRPGSSRGEAPSSAILLICLPAYLFGAAQAGALPNPIRPDEDPEALRDVDWQQKLGQPLPMDVKFRDESGKRVTLGEYFGTRPVVVVLEYYECAMHCRIMFPEITKALALIPQTAGEISRSWSPASTRTSPPSWRASPVPSNSRSTRDPAPRAAGTS